MNTEALEPIALRNGKQEAKALVASVMLTVRELFKSEAMPDVLALYDLAKAAADPSYDTSFTAGRLKDLRLLEPNGSMNDSIRNIVASALSVEGMTVNMRSPVAE